MIDACSVNSLPMQPAGDNSILSHAHVRIVQLFFIFLQKVKKWDTGSLLIFQQNLNTNVKNLVVTYDCVSSHLLRSTLKSKESISPLFYEGLLCADLNIIRLNALTKVEPHRIKEETCFLLLLSNLAEPDWISGSCKTKILHVIICATAPNNTNNSFIENNLKDKTKYCSPMYMMFEKKCISFKWLPTISLEKLQCGNEKNVISVHKMTVLIKSILKAVLYSDIQFLFCLSSKQILMYEHKRYLNTYQQRVTVEVQRNEGFYTFIENKNTTSPSGRLFQCNIGNYILHSQVCNGIRDCHNGGKDEKFCICDKDKNFKGKIFCID